MIHKIVNALGIAVGLASVGLLWSCVEGDDFFPEDEVELRDGASPKVIAGNPGCPDGLFEFKIDDPTSKTYEVYPGQTVTLEINGAYLDWSSTIGMDYVFMKGGPNAHRYTYDPESKGADGLTPPINPETGKPYGISHVTFCYDFNLEVEKTADTSFKRKWTWTIDKELDNYKEAELHLKFGQWYLISYKVTVDATSEDLDFSVKGKIKVFNPAPIAAKIESITDVMDGVSVPVTCPFGFPYTLAAGAYVTCTYEATLPDGQKRTNKAIVKTSGKVEGGSATASVKFGDPTKEIDECIHVTDDQYGDLGKVCADQAPKTFMYSLWVWAKECKESYFKNIASFITNDTKTTGSDKQVVKLVVDCDRGCTLTQGYWKTHSKYGPAPEDKGWDKLPNGADTLFFGWGKSYYKVLWTAPKGGDLCTAMAHQYIAAVLNVLNGADDSDIEATLDKAAYVLEKKCDGTSRKDLEALLSTLDKYNNGLIGPGHCDE